MKNYYPLKAIVPFHSVSVEMGVIIDAIRASEMPVEIQRAVYILIRNETGNGKSVVNGTNPGGVQSDSGQWPEKWDSSIVATCVMNENRTGNQRGFVVFNNLKTGIAFMCERIQARGLYIGGFAKKIAQLQIVSVNDLASAYYKEWVEGSAIYHIKDSELNDFILMYNQSKKIFL